VEAHGRSKDAAPQPLRGTTEWSFSTGGPAIVSTQPWDGSQIEEDQHFLLTLTGPVDAATAAANSWCEVEGIGERMPIVVVTGRRATRCSRPAASTPSEPRGRCS
jgi:hypothetical protein